MCTNSLLLSVQFRHSFAIYWTSTRRKHRKELQPFVIAFEGRKRTVQAQEGIAALRNNVDTLIIIPNDKLLTAVSPNTPVTEALNLADDILRQGVRGISDIITVPGLVNVDFADVCTIMVDAGSSLMGIGTATGKTRARDAALNAIQSPLLDIGIERATGIVWNITGGSDLTLFEQYSSKVIAIGPGTYVMDRDGRKENYNLASQNLDFL